MEEYVRTVPKPWTMLQPEDKAAIRKELNDYKRFEMDVHPDSEHVTMCVWCIHMHVRICVLHLCSPEFCVCAYVHWLVCTLHACFLGAMLVQTCCTCVHAHASTSM